MIQKVKVAPRFELRLPEHMDFVIKIRSDNRYTTQPIVGERRVNTVHNQINQNPHELTLLGVPLLILILFAEQRAPALKQHDRSY